MATSKTAERALPEALEERTQAIGRDLFAAATRHHAHLSVLNTWTAQVMSWCMGDPKLKASVLRFIDVLPSLATARDVARHVREYFPDNVTLPPALRLGSQLARPGLLTSGALSAVIHNLVQHTARQFIAESSEANIERVLIGLAGRGLSCSLDILGEQVLTEAESDRYAAHCAALLDRASSEYAALDGKSTPPAVTPLVNVSVKPSALTPRFDPISPRASITRAMARLMPLIAQASNRGAAIHLDMEHYELRDLTLELAQQALAHPEHGPHARLGVVIQAYLRDSEPATTRLIEWLTAHHRPLIVRLVKGAYWDSEVALAGQRHWPVPVYDVKDESDRAFERLTRRLLEAAPLVTTAIASHNVRSVAHAMAVAEVLHMDKRQLEFQFLYGMGEALHGAVASMGYPVRIYTPIGELIPGMAYLVRRILENTANESFLRQDLLEHATPEQLLRAPQAAEPAPAAAHAEPHGEAPLDFSKTEHRDAMRQALERTREAFGRLHPARVGKDTLPARRALTIRNPSMPDQVLGTVGCASVTDADAAVRQAAAAQPAWAATPVAERAAILRRAAALLRQRRYELAAWEICEVGKTWREADADVVEAIEFLEYYSGEMVRLSAGRPLAQAPGERNVYRYEPRGVAAVIAPWNFPAAILTGMTSAALMSGNAVVLKPSEQSSITAAFVERALREAGVPPGVLHFLPGLGEDVGAELVRHPLVSTVLFTGSKAVGLSIVEACAVLGHGQRNIKRVVAELGGKNALIVDADADLDAAVDGALRSAFGYGGQKCSAASRLIVHESVHDRLMERLAAAADRLVVGDPSDPATDLGPLVEASAQRRLRQALERARQDGRVLYDYPAVRLPTQGYFAGPAIVGGLPPSHPLATEELFGPFLCVFRVKSFADALAMANDSDYALTGGVYSRSPSHLDLAVRRFDVGNLYINRPITGALVGRQPFGGHKLSGFGTKAGGPDYLLQLMVPKTVSVNTIRHGIPLD